MMVVHYVGFSYFENFHSVITGRFCIFIQIFVKLNNPLSLYDQNDVVQYRPSAIQILVK